MGDQRVDERAGGVPCAGMHDKPGRLVDDDQRVVLIDDGEGYGFAAERGRHGMRENELEALARFDPIFHVLYGRPAA